MAAESTTRARSGSMNADSSPTRGFRGLLRKWAIRCNLYPHITLNRMPFKTFEFRELMRLSKLDKSERVLDLGCGTGTQTIIVGRRCASVVGVDTDPAWITRAREYAARFEGDVDCTFLHGPVESQGLETNSFQKVLSFCVIEHIPNADEVLRELYRILEPGGEMILSADALEGIEDEALIEKHRTDNHVVQYFRPESFRAALIAAGFEVEELYPIFRSQFARKMFEQGIRSGFVFGFFRAIGEYFRLRLHEACCRQRERGLFLVARCRKPSA
ncbi:MAG: class I SAM-dependent methyltransferase [Planctomycetota bacterium]